MSFRASGHNWRLHCGSNVLEGPLKEVIARAGAKRAWWSAHRPSIGEPTRCSASRRLWAERFAGVFDGIEKDFDLRIGVRRHAGGARRGGAIC